MVRRLFVLLLPALFACASTPPTPPPLAVLFLLDRSGSMKEGFGDLKKACVAGAEVLDREDYVAVLAFDTFPRWVVPFTKAGDKGSFVPLDRLEADGGSSLQTALLEALHGLQTLPADRAMRKKIVVVSDGDTPPADFEKLVGKLVTEGVPLSTICISSARFDPELMARLAGWGRGRFKFTASTAQVPRLVAQETGRMKVE